MAPLVNSSRPTTAQIVGGVYNLSAPAPIDGQALPLQFDDEGNLLVNVVVGGGGGSVTSKIEDSNGNPLLSNGAGALKVDGSLVTQPVSGTVAVNNFPATQPVSGTVAVSNFPATQPVSAASLPLPANAAQETGGNLATLAGTVSASKVGVTVSNFPTTQPVSGTVAVSNFPATQPISAVSLPLPSNAAQETGGNLATIAAAQGNAGSGITIPTGGLGILGWLSGIYNRLAGVVLAAGTAIIGKVGIDQTTPGTTNGVQVNAALPAGTNVIGHVIADSGSTTAVTSLPALVAGAAIIGKVGIDQTTPGTTNGVQVNAALPAGTNVIGHVIADTGSTTAVTSLPALVAGTALIGKVGIDQTTPGTTNAVQDVADGPVTAGTAATKSTLMGGVAATAAPTPTAGQQIAIQLDSAGNQRVNPFGSTGSVGNKSVSSTATTGTVTLTLTVPAAKKWQFFAMALVIVAANSGSPRVVSINANNAGGVTIAGVAAGVNAPINAPTTFGMGPGLPLSTSITNFNASLPFPALMLGPGATINVFIQNVAAADTLALGASILELPD